MCKNQFLLIVCIVASSLLSAGSAHTIDLNQIEDRMTGGKICDFAKSPFLVSVLKIDLKEREVAAIGNGILISPKFVVSVAFANMQITDSKTETYEIHTGCHQLFYNCSTVQRVSATTIYTLPKNLLILYPYLKDLILLETNKDFELGPAVAAAKLQTKKKGFATECRKGTFTNRAQVDKTKEVLIKTRCDEIELTDDASKCDAVGSVLYKSQLLGLYDLDKGFATAGDMGAPLVCDGYVVGIFMFNLETSVPDAIKCGLFVNLEPLYKWFNSHAKLNLPDWYFTDAPYHEQWPLVNTERNEKNASPTSTPNPINILIFFTVVLAIF